MPLTGSFKHSFNEHHLVAITQAICDYRATQHTTGPLYLGKDTHALSEPAFMTALEVLAAHHVTVVIDRDANDSVVGTYRLIQLEGARKIGRFYTAAEYDITLLEHFPGKLLELGRSCVDSGHRTRNHAQH